MLRILVAVALLGAQTFAGSSPSHSDQKFLMQAAAGEVADAKLGQLAIDRGIDPQVKALGRKMLDDHARMQPQLARLAATNGVSLSTRMSDQDAELYRKLSSVPREEFDAAFLDAVGERQKQVSRAFENEATEGHDRDVREWAARESDNLRAHRDLAEDARQHL